MVKRKVQEPCQKNSNFFEIGINQNQKLTKDACEFDSKSVDQIDIDAKPIKMDQFLSS